MIHIPYTAADAKADRMKAIGAFVAGALKTPVVINTDSDLTPEGKRTARVVQLRQGPYIRWYVSGRIYRTLKNTKENASLTSDWLERL